MKQGWEIKKLGEVVDVLDNLRKPITKRDRIEGKYPYYGATGILSYVHNYIFSEKLVLIGEDGAKWASGDNTSFIAEGKYWVNNHAHVIRPNRKIIIDEWIVYFLNFSDLTPFITGMTVPKLNQEKMRSIPIPLPPLPEQQRIVSILDRAFAAIDKAKANAEQNLQNAKELFESYLQGVFENGKDSWEEKTLDEVCEFRNGAAHEQHIDEDGKYILVNSKFISADGEKFKRTNNALAPLYVNDIAFVMSDVPNGKALAKCFLVDKNDTYTLNQRIGAIKSKVFVPEFLVYQFNRNRYLLSFNNGENQTNLRKGDILKCPLWLPSKEAQQTIVRQLDALRAETQKLEALYQKKIADLEELKKSILQKAFAGELKTEKALAI